MLANELESELSERIASGAYAAGARLPTIHELSGELDASYVTVQKAVKALERRGLLQVRRGRGTFVRQGKTSPTPRRTKELLYLYSEGLLREYEMELYQTFQNLARQHGYLDRMADAEKEQDEDLEAVAGAVATCQCPTTQRLQSMGVPMVYCTTVPMEGSISAANPDFHGGCAIATRHLHELGHRKIVFVGPTDWDLQTNPTFTTRYQGYCDAMLDLGLKPAPPLRWHHISERGNFRALLTSTSRPEALVVGNDMMAVGIMNLAAELGVKVPDDISVVGLEDMRCSRESTPPLTTVGYDKAQLAAEAAGLLLDMIEHKSSVTNRRLVPMRLIIRGTTRAPQRLEAQ